MKVKENEHTFLRIRTDFDFSQIRFLNTCMEITRLCPARARVTSEEYERFSIRFAENTHKIRSRWMKTSVHECKEQDSVQSLWVRFGRRLSELDESEPATFGNSRPCFLLRTTPKSPKYAPTVSTLGRGHGP